jgi:hypothetical protein
MTRRTMTATVEGRKYQIPEMWLVGASRTFGGYAGAIRQWVEQAQMEAEFNAQRKVA